MHEENTIMHEVEAIMHEENTIMHEVEAIMHEENTIIHEDSLPDFSKNEMLTGKKIHLRALQLSDADILYKWENDKSIWKVSNTLHPFSKKEIKDFISKQKDIYLDKQLRLMICLSPIQKRKGRNGEREKRRSVGCIDLFNFDKRNLKAGIGILIDKKHRKKGYASEALSLLIVYSFEILNLQTLFCNVSAYNEASMKVFRKLNFKVIAVKKNLYSLELVNK